MKWDSRSRSVQTAEFKLIREIKVVQAPVRGIRARFRSILDPDFTNIHGTAVEPAQEAWLAEAQNEFDLIWFFKLRTANLFANARWRRSIVDVDDVPSTMERTLWRNGSNVRPRIKAWTRMLILRLHEKHLSRRFDVFSVCSEADIATLDACRPIHLIPNGFAKPVEAPVRKPAQPPRIGFMGLYDYLPNLDGVRWFVKNCWLHIKSEIPGVRLRLIGEGTDGANKPTDPSVDGLGWVADPAEEISSWSLMIVPIRIGAGTRVKIVDAFSRKCPLVSTTFGAFGYDLEDKKELLLADDPKRFAAACISLVRNPTMAAAMSERAYATFLEKWTWDAIAPRVWAAAEDCLRRSSGTRSGTLQVSAKL